ncbi:MAG: asparagine synthetase B [bacterium]|nr:asparagine synthetase B [bacterium]
MCGIAAYFGPRAQTFGLQWIRTAVSLQWERGTDELGIIVDDAAVLAVNRLALRGGADGTQPRSDGSHLVAFNGEIYANLAGTALSAEESDSRWVARWLSTGVEISRLRGMFGIVSFDEQNGVVSLHRDRWGEKQLYYFVSGGEVFVSSQPQPLVALAGGDIDTMSINRYLALRFVPGHQTGWNGIDRVRPGESVSIRAGGGVRQVGESRSTQVLWRDDGVRPAEGRTDVQERLTEAVSMTCRADKPVGVLLSGGLDSTVVAQVAAEQGVQDFYTVGFSDGAMDERGKALAVTNVMGGAHHTLEFGVNEFLEGFDRMVWSAGDLVCDEALFPLSALCQAASADVSVLLTGDGADEVFGGYERYDVPGSLDAYLRRFGGISSFVPEASECLKSNFSDYGRDLGDPSQSLTRRDMCIVDSLTYLPEGLMVKADRAGMASTVELRSPFLLAFQCPVTRNDSSENKPLLRSAFAAAAEGAGKKQPFATPLWTWLNGPLGPWAAERLRSEGLAELVSPQEVERAKERLRGGFSTRQESRSTVALLVLESWERMTKSLARSAPRPERPEIAQAFDDALRRSVGKVDRLATDVSRT